MIAQIKYDLRLNDYSPKYTKNVNGGKKPTGNRAYGSKW
jgi:hypothetical protein